MYSIKRFLQCQSIIQRNNICGLVADTAFNTKIEEVEKKVPDVNGLITNTAFNSKSREVEEKILMILNVLLLINLINFQVKYLIKN